MEQIINDANFGLLANRNSYVINTIVLMLGIAFYSFVYRTNI